MFSLEQLRGFVAVAEERHFGRAAAQLNITQPPLSRQVQKLERAVGVRLLERDNRGVELTAAGTAFLAEAKRLIALADTAPDLARRIAAGAAGTVRVGFTAASTLHVLPAILNEMGESLPDIDVDLREMITREQTAALLGGEIDLGLARPRFDPDALASRLVQREPLRVVVPTGHRLAELGRPIHRDDLIDEPLIMHSAQEAQYLHELVLSVVPISGRRVVHTVSQLLTMVSLVSAGRGIAFIPDSAARLGMDGIEYLPLAMRPQPNVEMHLLWLKESRNPALWRLLETLKGSTTG